MEPAIGNHSFRQQCVMNPTHNTLKISNYSNHI